MVTRSLKSRQMLLFIHRWCLQIHMCIVVTKSYSPGVKKVSFQHPDNVCLLSNLHVNKYEYCQILTGHNLQIQNWSPTD